MNVPQQSPEDAPTTYTAFGEQRQLFSGPLDELLRYLKANNLSQTGQLLIFDDHTGRQVDFDLRGELSDVLARYLSTQPAGRGRPKLGVTSREVSLLPRHWQWLEAQGNASATLRRLIDEERRRQPEQEARALARAAADRFMNSLGGDLPGYQEATRALYAGERQAFEAQLQGWPADVRQHALKLAAAAF